MKNLNVLLILFGWLISISAIASPPDTLVVKVLGTHDDARFEPAVIQVQPGDVIRFEVVEGLHTVTAYHPDNRRPLRLPKTTSSFDSGILNAGDRWSLFIEEEGVFDYFCLPHEKLGHAGRIISGTEYINPNYDDTLLPKAVVETLHKAQKLFLNQKHIES
jgi:plastocyanin